MMKAQVRPSRQTLLTRLPFRLANLQLLPVIVVGLLMIHAQSATAALSFARGIPTAVASIQFASSPDTVIITGALTGPGTINNGLSILANRIQYDIINSDQGPMNSWTVYYAPTVGPSIIGAYTPLGYLTAGGAAVPEGGFAYTTLFNSGYGLYTYNTGAPWTIDYEPDHITFTTAAVPPTGLPANDGVGYLNPTPYLTSFAILYDPDLENGLVPATAVLGTATLSGQVYGPLPGSNNCLRIRSANVVVETCSNCAPVTFNSTLIDPCCSNAVVMYNPPSGTCFPVNTTSTVEAIASDACGNKATNFFTVTVNPGANCGPTNCITINASNVVWYTCNPCTTVPFNVTATDRCCASGGVMLTYNPPITTCFPKNSSTTVLVTAVDVCGNTANSSFTVTVLPGPTCEPTNCITINSSNIVVYTCDPCTTVPFNVTATDRCCAGAVSLIYSVPTNTCFPVNTTTPVQIIAVDQCNSATNYITVTVLPAPGCGSTSNCLSINASNIVAYTCDPCTPVPFTVYAVDRCCTSGATLVYNPPTNTCFPVNSSTLVQIMAYDQCGNTATNYITVTILPAAGCGGTSNCISINASNIVAYTCSNCTTVPFTATASDPCCAVGATLFYNPPTNTCFPLNTTTPVQITAVDPCGNSTTNYITVTVLPGANCGGTRPDLTIQPGAPAGGGTNLFTISWPAPNAQLEQSTDLMNWSPVPGGTNSPFVVSNTPPSRYFRLHYQ